MSFEIDMKWSSKLFIESVWPMLPAVVGKGDLMQMEGRPDRELALALDMRSGIDAWQLMANGQMRGIAARVQKAKDWSTFTIRLARDSGAKTEFAKRYEAIHSRQGFVYPHLTIHAYAKTETGPVTSVGVCRTSDVIEFITRELHKVRKASNATFATCHWVDMRLAGYRVEIVTQTTESKDRWQKNYPQPAN